MIQAIIPAVVALGLLGLLFGLVLAIASKKFSVEVDPRTPEVRDALPGANCGGCGYAGCSAFAEAVVKGDASADGCPVASKEQVDEIAKIMGVEITKGEVFVSRIYCNGTLDACDYKYEYSGDIDCVAAAKLSGGNKSCDYGCLGLGSCVKACQFDAITIENGIAIFDKEKCTGCTMCIQTCPKELIRLVPKNQEQYLMCKNPEKGKAVKTVCKTGCIGCGICEKVCQFDAIKMVDNRPVFDYVKCTGCNVCAQKCPVNIIHKREKKIVAKVIDEKCIGCTICDKNCKFDAVEGELKKIHKIIEENCTGCKVCYEKCPKDAIEMIEK